MIDEEDYGRVERAYESSYEYDYTQHYPGKHQNSFFLKKKKIINK